MWHLSLVIGSTTAPMGLMERHIFQGHKTCKSDIELFKKVAALAEPTATGGLSSAQKSGPLQSWGSLTKLDQRVACSSS